MKRAASGFISRMEASGLAPTDLAHAAFVSLATVYRARNGHVPGRLVLHRLSNALSITTDECRDAILRERRRARERQA